ncbi:hypothetical protein QUA62_26715, partial [Microcoleus sp. MON1_C1]
NQFTIFLHFHSGSFILCSFILNWYYYAQQESGIGVWIEAAQLLPSPIALSKLRQNWGHRWQPPQQLQRLSDEQRALLC